MRTSSALGLILFLIGLVVRSESLEIEKWIKPCDKNSENFNECGRESVQNFLKYTNTDIKELGIFSLSPLKVPFFSVFRDSGSKTGIAFNFSNTEHYGFHDMQVKKFDWDFEKNTLELTFYIEKYKLKADYSVRGKILALALQGVGDSEINSNDVTIIEKIVFEKPELRNGKHYLKIKSFDVSIQTPPGSHSYRLDNLFNNKEISDSLNIALNENSDGLFQDLQPQIERAFAEMHKQIFGNFFNKLPLEEIMINPPI